MNNTIFALAGRANSGKTKTIKIVLSLFKEKFTYAQVVISSKTIDIQAIITIGDIKIGIESQGDPDSRLEESLCLFVENGCDIIVCATRTSGMTKNWVNNVVGYDKRWLKQNYVKSDDQDTNNRAMAEEIVNRITALISDKTGRENV